jgi:NADPH:quinone reductase-like Zn-dependent oxidoreductase
MGTDGMQAWLWEKYGGPELLRMGQVPKPRPAPHEVLVKVRAVSVNAADWHAMRAKPAFARLTYGLIHPKPQSLGVDVAGQIESLGADVEGMKPGDEIFANLLEHGLGAFAEYVCVPVGAMAPKPDGISMAEAAAVPMSGVTALQGLDHLGHIEPTHRVLINGGSGGVGTFAVQIAHSYGPDLTVVTSPQGLDTARSLGADRIVDYTKTDFVEMGSEYDFILDTVGNRSASDLKRALAEGGKAAVTGFSSIPNLLGVSLRGGKTVTQVQAHVGTDDLDRLTGLITSGALRPVIDRTFAFAEIPAAVAYVEQGHARGKVVVGVP